MQPKLLFLIDGAAGTGKSDLIRYVDRQIVGKRATILRKFTTRERRPIEADRHMPLDLEFISDAAFDELETREDFYSYSYPRRGAARYGFSRADLAAALASYDSVFLIVRSAATIKDLIYDFPDVQVVPLFVYTIETLVRDRLAEEGYPEEEIEYRVARSSEAMDDLYAHPGLYARVIVNNCDFTTYQRQLQACYDAHVETDAAVLRMSAREHFHLPSQLMAHKERMLAQLERSPYSRNVFVMMRFDPAKDAAFELIRLVIENAGYNCVRADLPEWDLTNDDVYNPYAVLHCCKYGVALFDESNGSIPFHPNIAIELAVMLLQDKRCLMLKHESLPAPPFDLASRVYQSFSRTEDLVAIIQQWLSRL